VTILGNGQVKVQRLVRLNIKSDNDRLPAKNYNSAEVKIEKYFVSVTKYLFDE